MAAAEAVENRRLGRLTLDNCALFICDMQDKFRPAIFRFDEIVSNTAKLARAARILKLPIICTEQYPKGLGATVAELKLKENGVTAVSKTCFTMALPQVTDSLRRQHPRVTEILVCGVESHVCVLATCQDYLELGYNVHIVVDCCSSRSNVDRTFAYDRMKQMGAWLTTAESALLSLVADSRLPQFKQIQELIRDKSQDAGLGDYDMRDKIAKASL